jgi:hypothetical protein
MRRHFYLIGVILSVSQLLFGCSILAYRVNIPNPLYTDNTVLCEILGNHRRISTTKGAIFYVIASYSDDRESVVSIRIREIIPGIRSESPLILLGEKMKENSTFKFQNTTWQIAKIGHHGAIVNGETLCSDGGFTHIKKISDH